MIQLIGIVGKNLIDSCLRGAWRVLLGIIQEDLALGREVCHCIITHLIHILGQLLRKSIRLKWTRIGLSEFDAYELLRRLFSGRLALEIWKLDRVGETRISQPLRHQLVNLRVTCLPLEQLGLVLTHMHIVAHATLSFLSFFNPVRSANYPAVGVHHLLPILLVSNQRLLCNFYLLTHFGITQFLIETRDL